MADLKISALTASTTPLAGTEVLPIVQSSTTKQVSVANLTAGRAVSATSVALNGAASALTPAFIRNGAFSCSSFGADKQLATFGAYNDDLTNGGFVLRALVTDVVTEVARGGAAGLTVTSGNLIIGTSNNGVSFAANPAAPGVTSELLDDYETGTWTPTYTPASGAFGAITYNSNTFGRYTKVGNAVFIVGLIITDAFAVGTGTGQGRISGLPFTPSPSASASINYSTNFNLDTPTGSFTSGTDIFLTSRVTSNSSSAAFNSANFTTGASAFANYVYFQMNYVV